MQRALLFYDGDCPLCRRSVALVRRLDWRGCVEPVSLRDENDPRVQALPIPPDERLDQMHLQPAGGGKIRSGFAAVRWLGWRLPPLWLLAPLLYLPGMGTLGPRLYRWVARNRFRLVPCRDGVCTIQKPGGNAETVPRRPPAGV